MLEKKPELHMVLNQVASAICFIKLDIDNMSLQNICHSIDSAVEDKIKKLKETISHYECSRFMNMTIPVVFLTPIPSDFLPSIDKYFKSKRNVCHNRVIVNFERIQPEVKLEVEPCSRTLGRNSIFYPMPAIKEYGEPSPKEMGQCIAQPLQTDIQCVQKEKENIEPKPNESRLCVDKLVQTDIQRIESKSAFFKSNNIGKNFSFSKFIGKKDKNGYKKIENVAQGPAIPMCK